MLFKEVQRLGMKVVFGTGIVEYLEDAGCGTSTARATDGRAFIGDIVVAADGLGTKSHVSILGREVRAVPSSYAIMRGFPAEAIPDSSSARTLLPKADERPRLSAYSGLVITAPCFRVFIDNINTEIKHISLPL